MTRKFTTSEEYSAFYSRLEAQFSPEAMNRDDLEKWLRNSSLADTFALTREISIQIDGAQTIGELKRLQKETKLLTIHKSTLLKRIDDKVEEILIIEREEIIARGIVNVEEFAKVKKINLSEKRIGREEVWKGKKVLTIRDDKGRFKSWKKL